MPNPFTRHPAEVGETYLEHFAVAGGFGLKLLIAAGASFVHAVMPFLCKTTGSRTVNDLHQMLSSRNAGRKPDARSGPPAASRASGRAVAAVRRRAEAENHRALRELI